MRSFRDQVSKNVFCRLLNVFLAFIFVFSSLTPVSAQSLFLPPPGAMINPTAGYTPTLIRGLVVHPENPLQIDFIVDAGQEHLADEAFQHETLKLVKYFMAALTVPEKETWVNLSPYEKDRIVPDALGKTELGRDLLAQDYILKQLTASLMYPERELGKTFWDRVYAKARKQFGTDEIPVNTFNKVWIVPQTAEVYQDGAKVIVTNSRLKVMLEEDYLAAQKNASPQAGSKQKTANNVSSAAVREVLLPEIEKEVNEGKNFANLRQIYNSMILAAWYKINLKNSLLSKIYVDKDKIKGVDHNDPAVKQRIYQQYLDAFKKGVFNYVKEETDPVTEEVMPRKYFSGGMQISASPVLNTLRRPQRPATLTSNIGPTYYFQIDLKDAGTADNRQPQNVTASSPYYAHEFTPEQCELYLDAETKRILPAIIMENLRAGVFNTERHLKALTLLGHIVRMQSKSLGAPPRTAGIKILIKVLRDWDAPGVNDDKKRDFLEDVLLRDAVYPGGLINYSDRGHALNAAFAEGSNPYVGQTVERVEPVDRTDSQSRDFREDNTLGIREARNNVYLMPIGGLGDRLGRPDRLPRVLVKQDLVTNQEYLRKYIRKILDSQEESNRLAKAADPQATPRRNPLVLMTSPKVHDNIVSYLETNNYFGMEGLTFVNVSIGEKVVWRDGELWVINTHTDQIKRQCQQIVIFQQEDVPAMFGVPGQFFVKSDNPYKLVVKPHNHGDVHMLMYMSGLAQAYAEAGYARTVVYQDTNGEVFNAIHTGVGAMVAKKKKLNVLTVKLNPGEKVGNLVRFNRKDGSYYYSNVEYNERDMVFDDPEIKRNLELRHISSNDFLSGNLNVFIMDQAAYAEILQATQGSVVEIVNPKNGISRLEALMQGIYTRFEGSDVLVTDFSTRHIFNALKNSLANALIAWAKGLFTEHAAQIEGELYADNRSQAALAGMIFKDEQGQTIFPEGRDDFVFKGEYQVGVNGLKENLVKGPYGVQDPKIIDVDFARPPVIVRGVPYKRGARIVWSYLSPQEVLSKIHGGTVVGDSVISLDGRGIALRDVEVDGALVVQISSTQELEINGLKVKNAGWEQIDLTPEQMAMATPDQQMRGYILEHHRTLRIDLTDLPAGKYQVNSDGMLIKINNEGMREEIRSVFEGSSPAQNDGEVGGINLEKTFRNLKIKRDRNGVPLPWPQQPIQDIQIEGLVPEMKGRDLLPSVPVFMGLAKPDDVDNDYAQIGNQDQMSPGKEPEVLELAYAKS
ncbi:MAG: hypothetical protein HQL23_05385 [Candidatus Omnitrophica bacterium]|nr:hypothetical protein [Candidatus Omnitrophota bacterium]